MAKNFIVEWKRHESDWIRTELFDYATEQDKAKTRCDQIRHEGGMLNIRILDIEVVTQDYNVNVMTSYQQSDAIMAEYGDRVILVDEVRDVGGWLKQFRIVLKA